MKIIDLLNKIANGEEVPQKIKVDNKIYYYETFNIGKGDNYFTAEWREVKGYRINYDGTYYYLEIRDYNLNDEVEILEEEKKIPEKLDDLIGYDIQQFDDLREYVEITTNDLFGKLNKIIDTTNQLIDYLKSKGE